MPPRRTKPSGLTEEDVARLRSQLEQGRRPRVALSGPQFEAGATGSVIRIGDPEVDGADFLTVRVKVNGVTDELAFAPGELNIGRATRSAEGAKQPAAKRGRTGSARTVQPRAATATPRVPTPASAPAPPTPSPAADSTSSQPAGRTAPAESAPAPSTPSPATARPATARPATARPATPSPATPSPATASPATASPATAGRRRKAPAGPAVSVTISSTGASWSISASRGARTITRGVPVAPGVVTAIADLIGQPGLVEAVAEINEAARLQAEQRAEQLRAELSDLEAVLAAHRAPR